jgi:hypothetical protein
LRAEPRRLIHVRYCYNYIIISHVVFGNAMGRMRGPKKLGFAGRWFYVGSNGWVGAIDGAEKRVDGHLLERIMPPLSLTGDPL